MIRTNALVLSAAAILAAAGIASADTLVMTYNGHGDGHDVSISLSSGSPSYHSQFTGEWLWTRTGGTAPTPPANGPVSTFCIELTDNNPTVNTGNTYNRYVGAAIIGAVPNDAPLTTSRYNHLSELYGRFFGGLNFNNDDQMAAFQLAVWECVYDDTLSLTGGTFRAQNTNVVTSYNQATTWLAAINGTGPMSTLTAMSDSDHQDHLIPTPGAAALAGLGLLATGRRRRR